MKNLFVFFVLFLVSFVSFSQIKNIDSLNNELKNSLFYTTPPNPIYVVKYDFKNIYNGQKFINSIEEEYGVDLSFVDFIDNSGFKDIVVEGIVKTDEYGYYPFITTLSVIIELHQKGILIQTGENYVNLMKLIEL